MRSGAWFLAAATVIGLGAAVSPARADIDPLSGIDFVTIGSPGNAPWAGNGAPVDQAIGRGGVGYEYRIGRYEVTTAQWVEFYNAAFDRPRSEWIGFMYEPDRWGATETTPNTPSGRRWAVAGDWGMRPVGGINWRTAAIYCNWLCNGKAMNREAFLSGAYDVSTFGYNGAIFTDQLAHTPGAPYYIPTWDEWLKAAHYDPNKQNSDGSTGGWWLYDYMSDTQRAGGLPPYLGGTGNGNYGFQSLTAYTIPLGSYPSVMSPWGLYDTAGATIEWTEDVITTDDGIRYRVNDGSYWDSFPATGNVDRVLIRGTDFPSDPFSAYGFRIVATVPSPGSMGLSIVCMTVFAQKRRR